MKKYFLISLLILVPQFAFAGSQTYSTPGTYSFMVPAYSSMTVTANGGGGAAGPYNAAPGGAGGQTQGHLSVVAGQTITIIVGGGATNGTGGYGGGGAGGSGSGTGGLPLGGGGGGGRSAIQYGGVDIFTAGGGGGSGSVSSLGGNAGGAGGGTTGTAGGNAGFAGGAGGGGTSSAPGAGGSSGSAGSGSTGGAGFGYSGGGGGGYFGGGGGGGLQNQASGGGGGGSGFCSGTYTNACVLTTGGGAIGGGATNNASFVPGSNGSVTITWTPAVPTCTLSLDANPVAYGSGTTLRWSSTNTDISFYINNVGYVTPNTSSSASVQPSANTDYTGTAVGSGGTTTCKTGSGTPPGTLNITPPSSPIATINASSTSIYVGYPTNLLATFSAGSGDTLTADNIDEPLGTGQGANTNPGNKSISFTPASAGTYTFYARAQTNYYSSWTTYAQVSVTATVPPSCTPAYTCSGSIIQYTNSICQVSSVSTCVAPQFCSTGSSTCLTPTVTFNPSGNNTGHLQVSPTLVHLGNTTQVYWNVSNVQSCSVTGTNGDSWATLSSPADGQTSGPIEGATTYTLFCTGYSGASPATLTETVNVGLPPVFNEN